MSRYHVDTPAQLALVAIAIDQALGLRNAAGAPTPIEQLVTFDGGKTFAPASVALASLPYGVRLKAGQQHNCYTQPGTKARLIDGGDGTAALEIDADAAIDAQLGKTVSGVPLPTVGALVQVTRARQNALLPAGVRDKLDDAYADQVYAANTALGVTDTVTANAAITVELQNGSRAANAITRKGSRAGAQAIAQALGIKEE